MVGTIVQGNRLATAQGRDIGIIDMESDCNKTVRIIFLFKFKLVSNLFLFLC